MRELVKAVARGAALVLVLPRLLWFFVCAAVMGRDRALEGATQGLARVPGLRGNYMRRAFLSQAITACDRGATVSYGVLMSKADAEIGENVYVGPNCSLGLVSLEADVLLADGVLIP